MKVKGGYKIDVWFDDKIKLFGAAYKDFKGEQIGEAEFAPTKTLALQWLKENGPEIEVEKPAGRQGEGAEY
jgi:hypothetical protein